MSIRKDKTGSQQEIESEEDQVERDSDFQIKQEVLKTFFVIFFWVSDFKMF
jgi:hypothetical protein